MTKRLLVLTSTKLKHKKRGTPLPEGILSLGWSIRLSEWHLDAPSIAAPSQDEGFSSSFTGMNYLVKHSEIVQDVFGSQGLKPEPYSPSNYKVGF